MGLTSPCCEGIGGKNKKKNLGSRYLGQERVLPKSVPTFWDGKGNYQKSFPLFRMGVENQKIYYCCSGTGIQGVPVWKYTGTGTPAHALRRVVIESLPVHFQIMET